jgi:hypothetical protein
MSCEIGRGTWSRGEAGSRAGGYQWRGSRQGGVGEREPVRRPADTLAGGEANGRGRGQPAVSACASAHGRREASGGSDTTTGKRPPGAGGIDALLTCCIW